MTTNEVITSTGKLYHIYLQLQWVGIHWGDWLEAPWCPKSRRYLQFKIKELLFSIISEIFTWKDWFIFRGPSKEPGRAQIFRIREIGGSNLPSGKSYGNSFADSVFSLGGTLFPACFNYKQISFQLNCLINNNKQPLPSRCEGGKNKQTQW